MQSALYRVKVLKLEYRTPWGLCSIARGLMMFKFSYSAEDHNPAL